MLWLCLGIRPLSPMWFTWHAIVVAVPHVPTICYHSCCSVQPFLGPLHVTSVWFYKLIYCCVQDEAYKLKHENILIISSNIRWANWCVLKGWSDTRHFIAALPPQQTTLVYLLLFLSLTNSMWRTLSIIICDVWWLTHSSYSHETLQSFKPFRTKKLRLIVDSCW